MSGGTSCATKAAAALPHTGAQKGSSGQRRTSKVGTAATNKTDSAIAARQLLSPRRMPTGSEWKACTSTGQKWVAAGAAAVAAAAVHDRARRPPGLGSAETLDALVICDGGTTPCFRQIGSRVAVAPSSILAKLPVIPGFETNSECVNVRGAQARALLICHLIP